MSISNNSINPKSYFKDFISRVQYKIFLNTKQKYPKFKKGEIWWDSFGVNIGIETDGKNDKFNRPILIIKKFNGRQFWAVPITSKFKEDSIFYYKLSFNDKESFALLSQVRTLDSKRLQDRITSISEPELKKIKDQIKKLL